MPKAVPKVPQGMRKIGEMYYAWVQVRGVRLREKLSKDLRTAKGMLADKLAGMHRGKVRAAVAPRWEDVSARWLKSLEGTGGFDCYRQDLARFNEFLEEKGRISRLDEVTPLLLAEFTTWRQANRRRGVGPLAPRTINRNLRSIQHLCNWAVKGLEVERSPLGKIQEIPTSRLRKRRALTPDEIQRLLAAAPPHMETLLRFMLTTGCRVGEVISLTWNKVDLERGEVVITADVAKNGCERTIPLAAGTLSMLKRLRDEVGLRAPSTRGGEPGGRMRERFSRDHVFVTSERTPWGNRTSVISTFYTICRAAGIEEGKRRGSIDLHALRVTFATTALDQGADLLAVSQILGHHDPAFTLRVYDRTTPPAQKKAVESVDLPPRETGKETARKPKRAS